MRLSRLLYVARNQPYLKTKTTNLPPLAQASSVCLLSNNDTLYQYYKSKKSFAQLYQ